MIIDSSVFHITLRRSVTNFIVSSIANVIMLAMFCICKEWCAYLQIVEHLSITFCFFFANNRIFVNHILFVSKLLGSCQSFCIGPK